MIKRFCFVFFIFMTALISTGYAMFAPVRKHPYFVNGLEMSPDGRYVALDKIDGSMTVFDLERREICLHKNKPSGLSVGFCFTPDSKILLIIKNREISFFDLEKKEVLKETTFESPDAIFAMKFFKDGKRAVVGTGQGAIYIWNLETDEKTFLKDRYTDEEEQWDVRMLDISPDESKILSVMEDFSKKNTPLNGPCIWDVATLQPIGRLISEDRAGANWGKISPDGKKVIMGTESGWVEIFDATTTKKIYGPRWKADHTSEDRSATAGIGFLEKGKYFVTMWPYGKLNFTIWNTENYGILKEIRSTTQICNGAFATQPEKNLIVTGDDDGSITVYKFNPEKLTAKVIWRPSPPKAGDITWINPMQTMERSEEEIRDMQETLRRDNEYRRNYRWWNPATWIKKR